MKKFESDNLAEEIYINAMINTYEAKTKEFYAKADNEPFEEQPTDEEYPEHLASQVADKVITKDQLKAIAKQLKIDETRDAVNGWYLNHIERLMKTATKFLKDNHYEIDYARFFGSSPVWWEE